MISHALPLSTHSSPLNSHSLPLTSHSFPLVSHSLPLTSHPLPTMLITLPLGAPPPPIDATDPPTTHTRRSTSTPSHSATPTDARGGRSPLPRPSTHLEEVMRSRQNAILDALQRRCPGEHHPHLLPQAAITAAGMGPAGTSSLRPRSTRRLRLSSPIAPNNVMSPGSPKTTAAAADRSPT